MSEIAVTGAGGFIGSHLVDALLMQGERVLAIDMESNIPHRLTHLKNEERFRYAGVDVTEKQKLNSTIPVNTKKIFHLAAIVGVKNYCDDPLRTIDVNVGGLRNIIDIALSRNAKIVYSSTSEIYGRNPEVPWKETADRVIGPTFIDRWSYSSSKAMCEHILFAAHTKYNLPMVIVRFFNVYGPRQNPIFVVPAMAVEVINDRNPKVYDGGTQTRAFTYIDDAIEGMLVAADNPMAEGEVFNIGSSQETTIGNLAQAIIDSAGKSKQLIIDYLDTATLYDSYEDIGRRIPDVNKAKKFFNWETKTRLDTGLKKTIDYFKNINLNN